MFSEVTAENEEESIFRKAAKDGEIETIKDMIDDDDLDINARDDGYGYTALHWAGKYQ